VEEIYTLLKKLWAPKKHRFLWIAHADIGMAAKPASQACGTSLSSTDDYKIYGLVVDGHRKSEQAQSHGIVP
jgi:hypothetical protein